MDFQRGQFGSGTADSPFRSRQGNGYLDRHRHRKALHGRIRTHVPGPIAGPSVLPRRTSDEELCTFHGHKEAVVAVAGRGDKEEQQQPLGGVGGTPGQLGPTNQLFKCKGVGPEIAVGVLVPKQVKG